MSSMARELHEMKQHVNKVVDMKSKLDDTRLLIQECATKASLKELETKTNVLSTKKELMWLADLVESKAENKDLNALKLRFQEVD